MDEPTTHDPIDRILAVRLNRRRMLTSAAALSSLPALSAVLAACTGGGDLATASATAASEQAVPGGTLLLATPYSVTTLDPIKSVAAGDIEVLGQIYSRLLRRSPDGKEVLPGLAEEWESSADGLTWTFALREAAFSDGSPITADDVVFSFLRLRDQKDSAYPGAFQVIADVEAVDNHTVRFTLDGPAAPFLGSTEQFNAGIVPRRVVEKLGDDEFARMPVTSGGFRVVEWRPNERLVLEKNTNYWREGLPYLDGVEIVEVARDATRSSMLETGEADVAREIPWAKIEEFKQRSEMLVPLEPSSVINIILINHKHPVLKDVRVRQAMAMAIDREGLTNAITFGNGVTANSLLPSTLDYYDPNITPPAYDPEGARALLEEAGAVGAEIEFLADTTDQGGQLIQDQLNQVGLNVKINQVDSGGWWDKLVGADYGATLTWWYNEVPDPDTAVRWALCGSCGNDSYYTYYNNPQVNQLTEQGLHETDSEARAALYSQIQQISMEEVAQIPVYYQPYQNVYRSWVRDLHMNPAIQWNLDETWKDQ